MGLFCASQGLAAPSLNANDRKIVIFENAPPIPAPVNLTLHSRATVRIILKVRGFQKEAVTFSLKSEPEYGKARILPQVSSEWAELEYTPPQEPKFTKDTFKFVVSNSKGTSSDSIAEILIQDIGPRLELPERIDFGILQTGESRTKQLEIRNTGDMLAEGTISLSGEWLLSGGSHKYSIPPGRTFVFDLVIAPKITGALEGEAKFSAGANRGILILAKVEDWIHARPDPLFLKIQPNGERSANLILTNETELPQWVQIESERHVSHPYAVWLDPKHTLQVPVSSTSLLPSEQLGKLILRGSEKQQRLVLWRTATFGPSLGGLENKQLVLKARNDKRQETRILIWNQGGRAGKWSVQASAPYETSTNAIELEPGESTELLVSLTRKSPAKKDFAHKGAALTAPSPLSNPPSGQDGSLDIQLVRPAMFGASQSYSLQLTTQYLSTTPEGEEAPSPTARIKTPPVLEPPSKALPDTPYFPILNLPGSPADNTDSLSADVVKAILQRSQPGTENGMEIRKVTAHSVQVAFLAPGNIQPKELQVSSLLMETSASDFRTTWIPVDKKQAKLVSGTIIVNIYGLPSNSLNLIRIANPPSPDGESSFVRRCDIATLPEPHWLSPSRPYLWVLVPLLAFSAYTSVQRRRS